MATKTKKPTTSSSKSKKTTSSKKKGLNKKQWSIIAVASVLVLSVGGYFAVQTYQNLTSDAAGWTQIVPTSKKKGYASLKKYAFADIATYGCIASRKNDIYTINVKVKVTKTTTKGVDLTKTPLTLRVVIDPDMGYIQSKSLSVRGSGSYVGFTIKSRVNQGVRSNLIDIYPVAPAGTKATGRGLGSFGINKNWPTDC